MDQQLGIPVLFTAAITLALSVNHKFTMIEKGLSWSEAQAYCQAHHIDLANVENADDTVAIQNLFLVHNLNSSAWIGLHSDKQSWRWSMDDSLLGSFAIWDPSTSEPNNNGGNQLCIMMYSLGWYDWQCYHSMYSMCFDETKIGNDRYVLINENLTWSEAQSLCRANYTDLVTIHDLTEYYTVLNRSYGDVWIGLHRDGWKWTNASNTYSIGWAYNQPDNYNWDEDCGDIRDGLAADDSCSDIKPFICSAYPSSKLMIRLKVKSNQDVNDSALQVAILNMIKQKLVMYGMLEVIKVTWKKQQDGAVFKKLV